MHYIRIYLNTLEKSGKPCTSFMIAITYLDLIPVIFNIIELISKILPNTFFTLIMLKVLASLCRLIYFLQDMTLSHPTNLEPQRARHTDGHIREPDFTHFSPPFQ